jgi:CBS-domain-containing membrane protein
VVDDQGALVGIVSEGDLLHRSEAGTERRRPWWLFALTGDDALAAEYVRSHARKVADIMTRHVITARPEAPLHEIANLLQTNSIKRLPIVRDGQLVGIVSRANLIQAVASSRSELEIPLSDTALREKVLARVQAQPWAHTSHLNVTVTDGIVDLWGATYSEIERKAIRVAAEGVPGVRTVNDHLVLLPTAADS